MMQQDLNGRLIEQSLSFHGLPLIKSWNEEKGVNNLVRLGIQHNSIDTSVYHSRLKVLNFTDRTKRLRLHRFICQKADDLFGSLKNRPRDKRFRTFGGAWEKPFLWPAGKIDLFSILGDSVPPLEVFTTIDRDERAKQFFEVNIGTVTSTWLCQRRHLHFRASKSVKLCTQQ